MTGSSYSFLVGPLVAAVALGVIILICRWVFSTTHRDDRTARRLEKARARGDYGLLVPVTQVRTRDDAEMLRTVLQEAGIDVPAGMSVVGFDGTEMARHTHPPLTTVRSDPHEWGAAAARSLLTLTTTRTAPDVELAPAPLVTARSTGPAPGRTT